VRHQDYAAALGTLSEAMLAVLARAAVVQTGQAMQPAALTAQAALKGASLVFPFPTGRALSDATLGACTRRMNEAAPAGAAPP
jgi:hypothetical protein